MPEIHLLHGWKADALDVVRFMSDGEALETGLRLVFGGRTTNVGFIGKPIALLGEADVFASVALPGPDDARRLAETAIAAGFKFAEEPKLWAVRD